MSYSFSATATTKTGLKRELRRKVAEVMYQQPPHCAEMPAVMVAAEAMIDASEHTDGQSISAVLYGSVTCTNWSDPASALSNAQCNIQIMVG